MFFIFSHFLPVLMLPPLLKVRPRFIMRSESASMFYLKTKFSSIWKEGLVVIWCEKCFGKSTWVHSKTLPNHKKGNSNSRSCIRACGDLESSKSIFYFIASSVYWACYVFIKIKNLQECAVIIKGWRFVLFMFGKL